MEERLLDRYPLSEDELRLVLKCHDRSSLVSIANATAVAAAAHSGGGSDDNHLSDRDPHDSAVENEDRLPEDHEASPSDHRLFALEGGSSHTLLSVLPELSDLYRIALAKVFVVPSCAAQQQEEEAKFTMELETCLEALCTLLGRRGSGNGQQFLWDVLYEAFRVGGGEGEENGGSSSGVRDGPDVGPVAADRHKIIKFLYRVAVVAMALSSPQWNKKVMMPFHSDMEVPEGWVQSLSPDKPRVSRAEWDAWTVGNHLYKCLSTVFHAVVQFQPRIPPPEFPPPSLFPSPLEALAIAAMGALGTTNNKYHPELLLHDSDRDGLSFRVLQQALLGFYGPTLLVVRTTAHDCWGYRSNLPWKSSRTWYTSSTDDATDSSEEDSCYLFRLSPKWNRYRMIPAPSAASRRRRAPYHQYLNVEACHQPRSLKGLAVGGVAPDAPRLYVTDTLENCRCSPVDQLFEAGPLLSDDHGGMYFDVDRILLFAACDPSSPPFEYMRSMGQKRVQHMESARVRLATVDRAHFVEDAEQFTSLFAHRDQARGRCDFVAMDDESMGYYVRGKQPSTRKVMSPPATATAVDEAQQKQQDDA
jgi:TLD